MKAITYIKGAVYPGGTPTRYLVWVSVVLSSQALASILPSSLFYESFNYSHVLLIVTLSIAVGVNFLKGDKAKIIAAYFLFIVGLAFSTITISAAITSLSGIIFMLTWAMTLFVAERREYISFDLVTLFMVLMLISTVILLMFQPSLGVTDNVIILATGALLTAIDIYLVYVDFGFDRNFYQESRRTYANLEKLSMKLSEILSVDGSLDVLLWKVTEECVPFLDLEECVIYLYDKDTGKLKQIAAYGGKSTGTNDIIDPIEIDPAEGIVGRCFRTGRKVLIEEVRNSTDYIVDDEERNCELAVPILSNGEVIGVIDSEHSVKGFFKERHSQAFHIIASFCGIKITEHNAKESIRQAQRAKQEADRYKELDELKNRFITNISHDLKTPLSLIKAPAMQLESISGDKQVKKQASYILKNTEHLLRVVNQLLQLNRVDKGLNELYMEEVNLKQFVSKVESQYKGLAEKDGIDFRMDTVELNIVTDAFRLEQIVHNLVHNAFRYTGSKGRVSLSIEKNQDSIMIRVADNGPGIPEHLQGSIFKRFFKADENNHEGTGIGLSLVKEYATSLDGTVSVKSQVGEGTEFTVILPLSNVPEKKEVTEDLEEIEYATAGKPVMLVVEDHADLNDFICSYFEEHFHCVSAFDGEEALKKLQVQKPDIIISDLMMPNMDGNTFVKKIKGDEEFGHIPVIVLSAKSQVDSRIDLYDIGADNYLVKPFDINELNAVVNGLLEQRQKMKERFRELYLGVGEVQPVSVEPEEATDSGKSGLLLSAVEIVKENLDNGSLSIKEVTTALGVGRNRFQKEIKELTGLTPVEFIRSIRLNEAKERLQDRSLNISEVAYAVGFNNLSYFTRSFKSEFGMLPSEWQERS